MFDLSVSGLGRRFSAWRERQRAYRELSALDDHALSDIGVSRSEIPFLVFEAPKAAPRRSGPVPGARTRTRAA